MKALLKLGLFLMLQLLAFTLYAQANAAPQPDDDMNIFLLVFVCLFFGVMFGAAVVGACLAALLLLLFFALVSFGIVSASAFIALYKRSIGAGFKSFLLLVFGSICALFGLGGILVLNQFIHLSLSNAALAAIGFAAGLTGGILLGLIAFALLKNLLTTFTKKFGFN